MNLTHIRELFLNNLGLKLISLLLATLLWLQVASRQMVERDVNMQVEVVNLPEDLAIANDFARRADVRVRSPRNLSGEDLSRMYMLIDLSDAQPGVRIETQPSAVVNKPQELQVLRLSKPTRIELHIERQMERSLPVAPDIVGKPREGYEVSRVNALPSRVQVSGPESAVVGVESVKTVPINIEGRSQPLDTRADLFVDDDRVRVEESSARIVVQIEEERREVVLRGVPVELVPPDPQARLRRSAINVRGSVPKSFEGELDPKAFQALITTDGLPDQDGYQKVKPVITVPQEYAGIFRTVEPDMVEVRTRR